MSAPIILVPGFWLGAWAWDAVAADLRSSGHDVSALTLPGLESAEVDRANITIDDHVDAICTAIGEASSPVVLAVHSGAGFPGYAATDRMPDAVAAVVYVDTGAGIGAMNADFEGNEFPLPPPDELSQQESLDGLSEEQLATFHDRALPQPGEALRGAVALTNPARLGIPSTVVCTSYTSEQYKEAVADGYAFVKGLGELKDVTYVDMPTSHWPMWSRPKDLAILIGEIADTAS